MRVGLPVAVLESGSDGGFAGGERQVSGITPSGLRFHLKTLSRRPKRAINTPTTLPAVLLDPPFLEIRL